MSPASNAVFLSYASQDAEAARRICDALRAAGIEVWFDQSELRGGDAWDQSIRRQIKECALFLPVISANTQTRREGYFRLEWKLAEDRTHLMAKGTPFLVPVCIDETKDWEAIVPDSFTTVQWTRLANGETPPAFCERVRKLLTGESARRTPSGATLASSPPALALPEAAQSRRRFPAAAAAALGIAIAGAAAAIWRPWAGAGAGASNAVPATNRAAAAEPGSVAQARKIFDEADELNRERIFLAEEMVERALARNVADAEAWTLATDVSRVLYANGVDRTNARVATLKRQAERALALSASLETRLAVARARAWYDAEGSKRDLQELAQAEPGNWQIHSALGTVYRLMAQDEASIEAHRRACELSRGHPTAVAEFAHSLWLRQLPEMEKLLADYPGAFTNSRVQVFDVLVKTDWRGDLAGARATIAHWPSWLFSEVRGGFFAWLTAMWDNDAAAAITAARRISAEYCNDAFFRGPRAALTAQAHELAGRTAAAHADWRVVVELTNRELAARPDDLDALLWKATALACLGDLAAAEPVVTLLQQKGGWQRIHGWRRSAWARLWIAAGKTDRLFAALRARPAEGGAVRVPRKVLELDPAFAPLRGDATFQEIIRQAPAPEGPPSAVTTQTTMEKSVAVLPFANLSDDKANEYFSDGISEELLNVLAKVPGLKVSARTSAFYFKGRQVPIAEIAKQLGVAFLVEGSVRKSGSRLRITAQLINAANGFRVWSDTFDRELKDVFALQDEIAGLIAQRLQLELGPAGPRAKPIHPRAHELVLQGRHFWNQRSQEGFAKAEAAFNEAIALEPEYAAAHAGLAEVHAIRGSFLGMEGDEDPEPSLVAAERAARAALQLNPRLSEAHAVLGNVFWLRSRNDDAEAAYRRAFECNPSNATAHLWYAAQVAARGRLDLAIEELRSAVALDPLSFSAMGRLANTLCWARDYDEAIRVIDRAIALEGRPFITNRSTRARILLALGRRDEAIQMARLVRQSQADAEFRLSVDPAAIWVLQQTGRADEAEEYAAEVFRRSPKNDTLRSNVVVALGRFEEALRYLENRHGETPNHHGDRYMALFWGEMWDPFRADPRFHQLLVKLGCVEEYKVARETLARLLAARRPAASAAPPTEEARRSGTPSPEQ